MALRRYEQRLEYERQCGPVWPLESSLVDPSAACACPCPALLLAAVCVNAGILRLYEQRLEHERQCGRVWPLESSLVFAGLKAMALPYELHSAWRDAWSP